MEFGWQNTITLWAAIHSNKMMSTTEKIIQNELLNPSQSLNLSTAAFDRAYNFERESNPIESYYYHKL